MSERTFYFWFDGQVYMSPFPVLTVALPADNLNAFAPGPVKLEDHTPTQTVPLHPVAVSCFDKATEQFVFQLNLPEYSEVRFSKNFPFTKKFERSLIASFLELLIQINGEREQLIKIVETAVTKI